MRSHPTSTSAIACGTSKGWIVNQGQKQKMLKSSEERLRKSKNPTDRSMGESVRVLFYGR